MPATLPDPVDPVDPGARVEQHTRGRREPSGEPRRTAAVLKIEPNRGIRQRHDAIDEPQTPIEALRVARSPRRPIVKEHDTFGHGHRSRRPSDDGPRTEQLAASEEAESIEQAGDVPARHDHDVDVRQGVLDLGSLLLHRFALCRRMCSLELGPELYDPIEVPIVQAAKRLDRVGTLPSQHGLVAPEFGKPLVRLDARRQPYVVGASQQLELVLQLLVRSRQLGVDIGEPVRPPIELEVDGALRELGVHDTRIAFAIPPASGNDADR